MSRTGHLRRGAAGARLLALLALVLGLLGMHGLASTHHAAALPSGHAPSSIATVADTSVVLSTHAEPQQHDHAVSGASAVTMSAGSPPGGRVIGPAVPACDDDCPTDLAMLCAAVLVAAAAAAWLIAVTARRRLPVAPARGGRRARAPAGARRLLPRRDPVSELCVSRT